MLLSIDDAVEALEANAVSDATERVRWFNRNEITATELLLLARLTFHIDTCENCEDEEYHGEPEDWSKFQGVRGNDGLIGPLSGCIGGESFDVILCNKCRGEVLRILGV